jgi:hypothetical protein
MQFIYKIPANKGKLVTLTEVSPFIVRKRALNAGLVIKKGKFDTLCSAEWPTFRVGWPIQGSLSLDLIIKVNHSPML